MTKWYYFVLPIILLGLYGLHSFLAVNRPIETKVLVIEGWLPEASLQYASTLVQSGQYDLVVTNGGRIKQRNTVDRIPTYAETAKNQLVNLGVDPKLIHSVKTQHFGKSRTYSYAQSTINWLIETDSSIKSFNLLSQDAHARKSYALYKKAARKRMDIGIIAAPPVKYDPSFWFFSFYGIGFVVKNFFGYLFSLTI